ncbi:lysylphosphatidylglycerol synthase domain-containing protein [Allorhodopirellula heiligendammensis]|uniref:Lysylphosphatidylglycerol synthase TM region n=1 Tax=Allorhodopirellula heiligendammensis TaxID=2714739 RepID=A0A5C6BJI6_9BACT|nr:lysylphosphatidylglycerol synthase domain-containing protein [Allorhodopirellula heiligendammensis]TWU10604.1 hypothetical protein Poly21_45100 [Allorhodopirellula heiligendammensis]
MSWLAWIQRAVFLLVLIGLVSAASKAVERWQAETSVLKTEAQRLRSDAAAEPDPLVSAALARDAERRESSLPSLANVRWERVSLAGLLYACGLVPPGCVLHCCLKALAVSCTLRRAIAAQLLGHAGKYIPGKAMVVFLRVGAILPQSGTSVVEAAAGSGANESGPPQRDTGRPLGRATSSVFFETLVMMGVGAAVAGVLLWQSPLPTWVRGCAAAMAGLSLIPVCPPILRRILAFIAARRKLASSPDGGIASTTITWSLLGQCWLLSLVSWVLIGLSFAMLITAIPSFAPLPSATQIVTVATAAISLGMVLGFVSLLPGGAGVREYVTLLVLAPLIGQTHALLAVIAARLMFILVEAVLASLSAAYLRHLRYLQPISHG